MTSALALAGVGLVAGCASTSNAGATSVVPVPTVTGTNSAGGTAPQVIAGVQQVTVKAGDNLRFTPSTIVVHPGKVKLTLVNAGAGAPHNLQFPALPGTDWLPTLNAGQSAETTFTTPAPGNYQFVCSIHVRQGQLGTFTVLPH